MSLKGCNYCLICNCRIFLLKDSHCQNRRLPQDTYDSTCTACSICLLSFLEHNKICHTTFGCHYLGSMQRDNTCNGCNVMDCLCYKCKERHLAFSSEKWFMQNINKALHILNSTYVILSENLFLGLPHQTQFSKQVPNNNMRLDSCGYSR